MPDASGFEREFREITGRAPTPAEIKLHLRFDRLAKTTDLDPATLLLVATAERSVGPARDLLAFALALASFTAIAWFANVWAPQAVSVAAYCGALALGVAASAAYILIAGSRRA